MHRRKFFTLSASAGIAALPASGATAGQILATGDGIPHTTAEYTALLTKLQVEKDNYSRDGVVAELEKRVAEVLGKEHAIWMPTGTLANHLAVRLLAGSNRRVLVQAECHLYNDCGDCAQTLSGLNMIGLAPGKATFTLDEVEQAVKRAASGRVEVPIGALQIETPVRRMRGQRFAFDEMKKISAWARENRVRTHLDGARLFLESAYTGIAVKDYAALFDTVYVSMYKYFNAASGAILAGPKALLANLHHTRRMFGGGLHEVWPFAAVANHYFQGFEQRYRKAVANAEAALDVLAKDGNFEIERVPEGTNIFRLRATPVNAPVYVQRLLLAGVTAREPENGWFSMQTNETWARASGTEIAERFRKALG